MTNQEAIRFGKCILMVADDKSDGTAIEFTKLALKALEQGDVLQEIREEIVNLVKTYPYIDHMDTYVKEDEVLEIMDKYIESEG